MATSVSNLSWTASTNKPSWITISPSQGTGNTNIVVTVTEGEYGETDTAGTVTIRCTSCDGTIQPIEIPVTRCTKEPVQCSKDTVYNYTPVTASCDAQVVTVEGTYTSYTNCIIINDVCTCDENTGTTSYTMSLECNKGGGKQIDDYIYQEGGCSCGCSCESITVIDSILTWNYNEEDEKTASITIDQSCSSVITAITNASSTNNDFIVTSFDNNGITVKPNGHNQGTTVREGYINIEYNDSEQCENKIQLKQLVQGCVCENLTVTTSTTVNVGASTGLTVNNGCVNKEGISVRSSDASIATSSYNKYENKIYITGVSTGNATITVSYTAGDNPDCKKYITVNVGCPTITISPPPTEITCEGGEITFTANVT